MSFKWVPFHEGIPQNELANRLTGAAGQGIKGNSPQKNQPPLACSVSFALAKAAMKEQLQERWLLISMRLLERDHLSHVQLGHAVVSRFLYAADTVKILWPDFVSVTRCTYASYY